MPGRGWRGCGPRGGSRGAATRGSLGGLRASINFVTEDGRDEVRSLREVPIYCTDADAGLLRDLSNRGVHAGGCEHCLGRYEQSVEIALRVGAHAPTARSGGALRAGLDSRKDAIKVVFAGSSEPTLRRTFGRCGRGDRIRTCDLLVPNQTLYQTELRPEYRKPSPNPPHSPDSRAEQRVRNLAYGWR